MEKICLSLLSKTLVMFISLWDMIESKICNNKSVCKYDFFGCCFINKFHILTVSGGWLFSI